MLKVKDMQERFKGATSHLEYRAPKLVIVHTAIQNILRPAQRYRRMK